MATHVPRRNPAVLPGLIPGKQHVLRSHAATQKSLSASRSAMMQPCLRGWSPTSPGRAADWIPTAAVPPSVSLQLERLLNTAPSVCAVGQLAAQDCICGRPFTLAAAKRWRVIARAPRGPVAEVACVSVTLECLRKRACCCWGTSYIRGTYNRRNMSSIVRKASAAANCPVDLRQSASGCAPAMMAFSLVLRGCGTSERWQHG